MQDSPSASEPPPPEPPVAPVPRWVKVFIIAAIVVGLVVLVIVISGHVIPSHGP